MRARSDNRMLASLTAQAIAIAVVLIASAAAIVTGQMAPGAPGQPPSSAGLVIKGKAPVSNDVLKVTLPKPQKADLPNGLHLMVLEDRRLPRIAFQIIVPGAGGYYDPPAMIGLSSYTAQMMREGTTTKSSQQISQELETMSANVTVGSGTSGTFASVSGTWLPVVLIFIVTWATGAMRR